MVGEESVLPCRREPKINQKASRMVIRGVLCAAGVAAVERDEDPIRSSTYSTMDTTTKAPSVQIHTMGDRGFRNCIYIYIYRTIISERERERERISRYNIPCPKYKRDSKLYCNIASNSVLKHNTVIFPSIQCDTVLEHPTPQSTVILPNIKRDSVLQHTLQHSAKHTM